MLQEQKISLNFLDEEERFPCPHGTMVRRVPDGRLKLSDCSTCCAEYNEKTRLEEAKWNRERRFNKVMWNSEDTLAIPKRFNNKTFDNFMAKSKDQLTVLDICKKFSENFESAIEKGVSLVFCGKPGTGKTHLVYAITSILRKQFFTAVVKTAADITSEVKEAYKSEDNSPTSVVKKYATYDLLSIDEVGVQVDSGPEKRIFFDIINKRYENMLPTIMISNLELNELSSFVGERVMDRMRENGGGVFAFDWKSYR